MCISPITGNLIGSDGLAYSVSYIFKYPLGEIFAVNYLSVFLILMACYSESLCLTNL